MTVDTASLREYFPLTQSWTYLNHATHGPLPTIATEAIADLAHGWRSPPDLDHTQNERTANAVREMIARLINGHADRVAFTGNLAESMSLAASGIDWQPGENCVIPEAEFPSVVYPFLNLAHRDVEVRFAPKGPDRFTSIDCVRALADSKTRAIVLSHVEFMDGFRNDLAAYATLCRDVDALLIADVTQSLGPCVIDVESTGVDVVAAHSYKWLMASYGVGVTHLSERAIERIRPTYSGRLAVDLGFEDLTYELKWRDGARRYQTGGLNWITLTGLEKSLEVITSMEADQIASHTLALTERLLDGLETRGYAVQSNRDSAHRSAIVAFSAGSPEADGQLVDDLQKQHISVARRGRGVRVSPYFYNTESEVEHLLETLPAVR